MNCHHSLRPPKVFDIRHEETVVSLVDKNSCGAHVGKGVRGKVIAMRTNEDHKREYLVKWERRAWPVALTREEIERVVH